MTAPTPDIAALNARRRRAVELRLDGRSLSEVRAQTGLSVPTIIQAYRAFQAGGWAAIAVGARGRPRGDGRVLDTTQEQSLRLAALFDAPERHGLATPLWTGSALRSLAQRHFGTALEPRAVSRLLERWGLSLVGLRPSAGRPPAEAAWIDDTWAPAVQQAREQGSSLAWAGHLAHPDLPPAGGLLVAMRPRGSLAWLPVRGTLASADAYLGFLARLLRCADGPWQVFLHGPDFRRVPQVQAWLAGQRRLALQPCPLAPRARRRAEPATPATPLPPTPSALASAAPTSVTLSPAAAGEQPGRCDHRGALGACHRQPRVFLPLRVGPDA